MWEMESNKLYQFLKEKENKDYILLNNVLWWNYFFDLFFFLKRDSFKQHDLNSKVSVECDVYYWDSLLKTIQCTITSTRMNGKLTDKLIEQFSRLIIQVWDSLIHWWVVIIPDNISCCWNKWKWANENITISNCGIYNHRYQLLYKHEWAFNIEYRVIWNQRRVLIPTNSSKYHIFKREWLFELEKDWSDFYIKSPIVFSLKDLLSDNNQKVFFKKKDWKYFYSDLFLRVNNLLKNHNYHDSEDLEVEFLFDQRKFRISLEYFVWKDNLINKLKEMGFITKWDTLNGKEYLEICYNETYNIFFTYKETENLFLIGWVVYLTAEKQLVKLNKDKTFTLIKENFIPFKSIDIEIFGINIEWKRITNLEEFLISDKWFYSILDDWKLFICDFQWNIRTIEKIENTNGLTKKEKIFSWWTVNRIINIKIIQRTPQTAQRYQRYAWDVAIEENINETFKKNCYYNQRIVEIIHREAITSVSEEVIMSFILQDGIKGKMIKEFDVKNLIEDFWMNERNWYDNGRRILTHLAEKNIIWEKMSSINFWGWISYFRNKLNLLACKLTRFWKFFYLLKT